MNGNCILIGIPEYMYNGMHARSRFFWVIVEQKKWQSFNHFLRKINKRIRKRQIGRWQKQRQQTKYNWILTSTDLLTEKFTVIEWSAYACIFDTKMLWIDSYDYFLIQSYNNSW